MDVHGLSHYFTLFNTTHMHQASIMGSTHTPGSLSTLSPGPTTTTIEAVTASSQRPHPDSYLTNPSGPNDWSTSSTQGFNNGRGLPGHRTLVWTDDIRLPFYILILFLAVTGNGLVIVTLVQNKKMRTVTNVFLLNLSVSDLLLAIFCMPFTLIPALLKNFIFGETLCVSIRYLQGVSVSVSCFTLVAISLERYFAICKPLHSRSWQTLSHAYMTITVCWVLAGVVTIPIGTYTRLRALPSLNVCREFWTSKLAEKIYTISLDNILLLLPMAIMSVAYGKIVKNLWEGIRLETQSQQECRNGVENADEEAETMMNKMSASSNSLSSSAKRNSGRQTTGKNKERVEYGRSVRQSNSEKSRASKIRVIRMLFVIVLEFFVCWSPLYVVQTWIVFDEKGANALLTPTSHSFIQLLAYVSSCCNPITYCFMNNKFRQAFVAAFRCLHTVHPSLTRRETRSVSAYSGSNRTINSRVLIYDKMNVSEQKRTGNSSQ
ncbi:cholecystokinin receptor type A-like [Argonauta hians]